MAQFQANDDLTYLVANRRPATPQTRPTPPAPQSPYTDWLRNESQLQPDPISAAPPATTVQPSPTLDTTGWNAGGYAMPQYTASNVGNVIGGWEAANWNDPTMQTPKYAVGRILSQYPSNTAGLQQAFAEIQRAYPGSTLVGKDSIMIPGVGTIDVGGGFGGTNERWQWLPTLDPYGNPYPQDTGGGAGGTGGTGGTQIPLGNTAEDELQTALRAQLMQLLGTDVYDVNESSPDVSPVITARRMETERARRGASNAAAERLAAMGLESSGAADAAMMGGFEDAATQNATAASNAIQTAIDRRRYDKYQQAFNLATQLGMTEEAQNLQRQLANLSATMDLRQMAQQNTQFNDQLGWDMGKFKSLYDMYLMEMLAGQGV